MNKHIEDNTNTPIPKHHGEKIAAPAKFPSDTHARTRKASEKPLKPHHRRTPEEKKATVMKVLDYISLGYSLAEIAKQPGMPRESLLCHWLTKNEHSVAECYSRAREARSDHIAREIFEIADNADENSPAGVNKARLQVAARQWYLAKLHPEKYGDHIEVTGKGGAPLTAAAVGAVGIAAVREMRDLIFGAIGNNAAEGEIIEAEEVSEKGE